VAEALVRAALMTTALVAAVLAPGVLIAAQRPRHRLSELPVAFWPAGSWIIYTQVRFS
jgi:hypothetical protein